MKIFEISVLLLASAGSAGSAASLPLNAPVIISERLAMEDRRRLLRETLNDAIGTCIVNKEDSNIVVDAQIELNSVHDSSSE